MLYVLSSKVYNENMEGNYKHEYDQLKHSFLMIFKTKAHVLYKSTRKKSE